MSLTDLFKDLDPTLAEVLDKTTRALRAEFDEKLELAMSPQGEVAVAQAVAPAPEHEPEPEAGADAAALGDLLDPVEELKHAVTAIDACGSQGEVLEALVAGCARFSSRAAVFLLRGGDAFGWGGHGFDLNQEEFKKTRLQIESAPAWAALAGGSGAVALSTDECRRVTNLLSAKAPQMGILLPFVLGNQPAAVIYCDRLEDDQAPQISALQILIFIASQVLENLPVRDRDHTATLRLSDSGAAVAMPVVEPIEAEPAPVDTALPAEDIQEIRAVEPQLPPISEPEPPVAIVPESAPEPIEVEPEPVEIAAPVEDHEEIGALEPSEAETSLPRQEEPQPPAAVTPASEPEPLSPVVSAPAPQVVPESATPVVGIDAPAGPAPVSSPGAPVPPLTPPTPGGESSTQVAPPEDVKGPGWAFTSGPGAAGSESAEGSEDEEARRLARLLVTEIKLYNEEQVEQGRLKGNVYSLLREDIDRSRQIFEDRIDDQVRGTKDYFHEACVRILAGGDPSVLGF
ncbi:MAG: hypothetical protein OES47_02025 [Acidobacteriota bacterium]|nr:hypothetical protein [Acidobacteriota bacterium]